MSRSLDDGVAEEEDGGDYSSNGHRVSSSKEAHFSKTSGNKRTEDGADVSDGVIAPSLGEGGLVVGKAAAKKGSASVILDRSSMLGLVGLTGGKGRTEDIQDRSKSKTTR